MVLTGCGGAPQCNDAWAVETATELYSDSPFVDLIPSGIVRRDEDLGTSVCAAKVYGRIAGEIVHIENITYETYLKDDGEYYVRLL